MAQWFMVLILVLNSHGISAIVELTLLLSWDASITGSLPRVSVPRAMY